jgi:hypothetical protein
MFIPFDVAFRAAVRTNSLIGSLAAGAILPAPCRGARVPQLLVLVFWSFRISWLDPTELLPTVIVTLLDVFTLKFISILAVIISQITLEKQQPGADI